MGKHAVLEIERRCNQACVYCSVDKEKMREVTTEEIKEDIDKIIQQGMDTITLTGGEPTVNKKLCEIMAYCKTKGIKEIVLQTNGVLLSVETYLKRIMDSFDNIEFLVSFPSSDPLVYEQITGVKRDYGLAIKALENISRLNATLSIGIVISSLNYKRLEEDVRFLHSRFPGIKYFNFIFIDPVNEAKKNQFTVAQMYLVEMYLYKALDYIRSAGLKASIDRLPLCYLRGYEEYSANTREIINQSTVVYSLLYKEGFNDTGFRHHFRKVCDSCRVKGICGGLSPNYIELFGSRELYPVFDDVEDVVKKVRRDGK